MNKNYSLKLVSKKTGLSAHVIRAWEKRYGVVNPDRTDSNRRFYTDREIEKLKLLKKATDSGNSIGNISNLTIEQLQELVLKDEKELLFFQKKHLPEEFDIKIKNLIDDIFESAETLNSQNLRFLIHQIEDEFSKSIIIEEIIIPVLTELDENLSDRKVAGITKKFILAEFSFYLQQIINNIPDFIDMPLLLCCSPKGGFHEIGSIVSACVAKAEKWRIFNLGSDISASELKEAVLKLNPDAISISMLFPFLKSSGLNDEILSFKDLIPDNVKILFSGRAVWNCREEVNKIGGIFAGNTFVLRKELQKIANSK